MISRYEIVAFATSGLQRYLHRIAAAEMEKYGLKGSFALYLLAMSRYSDGVTATELCEICDKNKAAVSRTVAEMEELGLVERSAANNNLYRVPIRLTDKGRDAAQYVSERARLAVEAAGEGLTDEHREIFYSSLRLIVTNLRRISEEGIPED